jgi:hypothetical protein
LIGRSPMRTQHLVQFVVESPREPKRLLGLGLRDRIRDGRDGELLAGRNETYFSQKVRNLAIAEVPTSVRGQRDGSRRTCQSRPQQELRAEADR